MSNSPESDDGIRDMSALNVKYQGKQHDIDAEVLLKSVGAITKLISNTNDFLDGDENLKIRISAPERGSFEFDINLLRDAIGLAFGNSEVARYTAIVGKTVVGLFKLHSFLGGEDPASVEVDSSNSQVFNNTGDVIIVDNSVRQTYVESDAVRKNLDDTYRATRGDERIEGIEIESEDDPDNVFQAECETFDQLAGIERESKEGEERTIVDRLTLTIISVVFDPDRKWEFLYEGRKITAKISDAGFWFRVKGHKEDFRQGDRMDVDLERVQTYNPKLRDWVTDEHEVIKVHDRFRASPQLLMFGDTDE